MYEKRMRDGSIWYLLSLKWFAKWQKFMHPAMGYENPGKVENTDILVDLTKENHYLEEKRA